MKNNSIRVVFPLLLAAGCSVTSHHATVGTLGEAASTEAMEAKMAEPGRVTVERVVAAKWAVPLSGLLNLDHPKAEAAGLEDREEAIEIYFYVVRHPEHGTFIVDSGVGREFQSPDDTFVSGLVASQMNLDALEIEVDTASWLEAQNGALAGVFLTHLHLDHIMGLRDVPEGTPIYVGPGETEASLFINMFVQGTTDRALEGHDVRSWATKPDPSGTFEGLVDVFGDGSFFAIHVPGHTPGSMAFVAITADGPVMMVGDTSHTTWGWDHGVEPGDFTADREGNAESLKALRALAARHPNTTVHLGHQHHDHIAGR